MGPVSVVSVVVVCPSVDDSDVCTVVLDSESDESESAPEAQTPPLQLRPARH